MKKYTAHCALVMLWVLAFCGTAFCHYGMVIPSDSMIMQHDSRKVHLTLSFSHPFEGSGMELVRPKSFWVVANGEKQNLLDSLKMTTVMKHAGWETDYSIKRPGVYIFCMEPKPYWEPGEDCFIVHYTKSVVTAFGYDEGWDEEIGLKAEIVPLSKPYGLYVGNVFQGVAKVEGKPVPYAEIEVEYYNQDGKAKAPTDYMVTQTIKADANGVFTYAVPRAGWWGFAALNTADEKLPRGGEKKDVEIGAVIWVRFHNWMEK